MLMQRPKPWDSYRKVAHPRPPPPPTWSSCSMTAPSAFWNGLWPVSTPPTPSRSTSQSTTTSCAPSAIIHEMNANLDMEAGGEISRQFRRLYNYLHARLPRGQPSKKQKEPLQESLLRLPHPPPTVGPEMLRHGPDRRPPAGRLCRRRRQRPLLLPSRGRLIHAPESTWPASWSNGSR